MAIYDEDFPVGQLEQYLRNGLSVKRISAALLEEGYQSVSESSLKRAIKYYELADVRPVQQTIQQRSQRWVEDVKRLMRGGATHNELLRFLELNFNEKISNTSLVNVLAANGIQSNEQMDANELVDIVYNESQHECSNMGYRNMTNHVRQKYEVNVSRDTVALVQKALDPDAVAERRKKKLKRRVYLNAGPNHVWHFDGFDKLTRFGFSIHACIDGFSRKILWLYVGSSNRLPKVILALYLETCERLGLLPKKMRSDHGSENIFVAAAQMMFMGGQQAFTYGPSTSNQRVESWWNQMDKMAITYWIHLFKDLEEQGTYDYGSPFERACAYHVYAPFLQESLFNVQSQWNCHRIRNFTISDIAYVDPLPWNGTEQGQIIPENFRLGAELIPGAGNVVFNDLFGVDRFNEVFCIVLQESQLYPITKWNMSQAFQCLRTSQFLKNVVMQVFENEQVDE